MLRILPLERPWNRRLALLCCESSKQPPKILSLERQKYHKYIHKNILISVYIVDKRWRGTQTGLLLVFCYYRENHQRCCFNVPTVADRSYISSPVRDGSCSLGHQKHLFLTFGRSIKDHFILSFYHASITLPTRPLMDARLCWRRAMLFSPGSTKEHWTQRA